MHAVEKSKLTGHPMTTALSVSSSKFKWQWPNCPFLLKISLSPLHHSKFKVQTTVAQSPLSIRDFPVSSSPKFRQQWPKSPLSIQDVPVSSSPFKVQTTVTQITPFYSRFSCLLFIIQSSDNSDPITPFHSRFSCLLFIIQSSDNSDPITPFHSRFSCLLFIIQSSDNSDPITPFHSRFSCLLFVICVDYSVSWSRYSHFV